jgi:HSP20 family protein
VEKDNMSEQKREPQRPADVDVDVEQHYHLLSTARRFVVMRHSHVWHPPTDMVEHEDLLIVLVEVAGMKEGEFHVAIKDRHLIVTGRRPSPLASPSGYYQLEIRYGDFRTDVILPWAVAEEAIQATYSDGFLRVELPRAREQRVRIVDVDKSDE